MTSLVAFMAGLVCALALAGVAAARNEEYREPLLRTGFAVFACWLAGLVYVQTTDDYTPWHFNIFTDALAASIVMLHPAARLQAMIGLLYFVQIAWHTAYGIQILSGNRPDALFYYDAITWVAWAQLAVLGAWGGGIEYGDYVRTVRNRRNASRPRSRPANTRERP